MNKIIFILSIFLISCSDDRDTKYTIEIEKCDGKKKIIEFVGKADQGLHISTYKQAVPVLSQGWKDISVNVCDYKILKIEKVQ